MTFNLDGIVVRWPDGTGARIRQHELKHDTGRSGVDAYVADLEVEKQDAIATTGRLRFTGEAYERLPGKDDREKQKAVVNRLALWIAENGLRDGFFLKVDADDSGVQISEL